MMSISDYLTGKHVFITGGSGFIGKALIEMLLRCSPGIGNIYILLREKRGKSVEERVQEITDNPLFDILKEQQPGATDKIIPISGDTTKLKLGISEEDEQLLISRVNIIYHVAASVRFDDLLKVAIMTNLRSTTELVSLALKCERLEVYAHISTSYSNAHMSVIDEKCYPSLVRWQDALVLAEQDHPHLEALTLKYIAPMPNTYTFTKSLAENAVVEMCKGKIPFVILRPSIVINSFTSPIPGWGDNLYGPFGLTIATMKGVMTLFRGDSQSLIDFVYVDNVVKACIIAVWKESTKIKSADMSEISVYNLTTDILWMLQWCSDVVYDLVWKLPLTGRLWYHNGLKITNNFYYCRYLVTHVIPALFFDALLKLTGRAPKVLKVTRRIYMSNIVVNYFSKKTFAFNNENYRNLEKALLESEREIFKFYGKSEHPSYKKMKELSFNVLVGMKKYILHEPVPVHEETLRNTQRLLYLDIAVKLVFTGCLLYLLFFKMDILTLVSKRMY